VGTVLFALGFFSAFNPQQSYPADRDDFLGIFEAKNTGWI